MPEPRFILKILSGLHTGAEYYLPPGVTRLGKSAQCDLALHDKGIEDEHFAFTCSTGGVEIQCLAQNSPTLLDGVEQTGSFTIKDFGVLSTSALYLAVGAEDNLWRIPAPSQLFFQPDGAMPPAPGHSDSRSDEQDEIEEESSLKETIRPEEEENMTNVEEEPGISGDSEAAAPTQPDPGPRWRRWLLAGSLIAALTSATGLYWYGTGRQIPELSSPGPAPHSGLSLADIKNIAERHRLDASFELNADNTLLVKGYALSAEDEHDFIRVMYDNGIIVRANLIITEQFRNNIQNILQQYIDPALNEQVTTSIAEDDIKTLVLRGYVQDAEKWQDILFETVGEVDSINYIDEVTHWDNGYQHLRGLLERYAVNDWVHVEQDMQNDTIFLYNLSSGGPKQNQLSLLVDEYQEAYVYPEVLVNQELETALNAPDFGNHKLVGAGFNARPYILFDNGRRYFVGSTTPEGYRVEDINEQFAVLSRDGTKYHYKFDDPDTGG